MIAHLRGTLLEKGYDHVVVEVGGVGLRVQVSLQTLAEVGQKGQEARLHTHLQVREDALTLFGFATESERTAFELLTSVQGIGPKLAMAILSALTAEELAAAVGNEDVARLKRIPGIGLKTAERMVLELRSKLDRVVGRVPSGKTAQAQQPSPLQAQVVSALTNLGYKPAEAERAAEAAVKDAPQAHVAELVKRALRALAE